MQTEEALQLLMDSVEFVYIHVPHDFGDPLTFPLGSQ